MGDASPGDARVEALNRRDRAIILLALAGVTALAWIYLLGIRQNNGGMAMPAGQMETMPDMAMPMAAAWTPSVFALMFAMWWVMILGMMVPSAAPMILTFATLNRSKRARGQSFVPPPIFAAGYLIAWGIFSLAATAAQWALDAVALLSPDMAVASGWGGGILLVFAGVYQFTPLKQMCLHNCRSPFAFVMNHWRDGWTGALRLRDSHN